MPKTVFTPLQETNDPNVISQWLQDNRAARERFGRIGGIARAGNPEDEAIIRNARQMAAEYDKIQALIQQSQPAPQQPQRREEAPSLGTAATGLILGNRRMAQERTTKEAYGVAEKTEVERRYNQLREARQRLGSIPDDKPFERSRVRGEIERLERDLDPKNVRSPEARQYASDIIRQERNEFVNEHLQRLEARRSSLDPRQPDYDREYAKITSQIERTNEYSRFVQDGMTDAERGLVRAGQEISSWGVVPRAFFVTGSGFIDMLSSPTNIVSMAAGGRPSSQRFISEGLNAPERQTFSERRGEWDTEKLSGFSNLVSQAMYSLPMTLITAVNAPLGVALTYTNMVDMNLTDMVRKYGSVDEVPAMSLAGSVATGVISGAVESLSNVVQVGIVNKLFKTSGFSGAKGYLKSILTNKGALLNFAKGSLQGSLIEGAEEWVDQLAGNLVYNMVGEQNKSLSEMIAESNQAFLSGAFGGALFGVFGGGYQGFTQRGHWATTQKLAKGGNAQARLIMEVANELQNDKPDIARVRAATETLMRQVDGIKNKSLKTAAANILDLTYANGIVKTVFEEMKRQYPNNPAIQAIDTEKISQDVYSLYQRINKISPEDRKSMSGRSKITLLNTLRAALQEASFGRTDKAKAVLAGLSKLSSINRVSQDQFYESFNKIVTDLSGLVSQLDSSVVSYNEARATETPAPRFDDQLVERAKSANSSKEIGTPELEDVSRDLQLAIDTTENPAERSMYGVWKRVIDQRIEKRKERDAPVGAEEAPKVESPKEAPKVQTEPVKPVTPINAGQTKIIIELKAEKAISDADYRAMLQEVSGGRADTAGNLSLAEAASVIDRLQEMPLRKKKSEPKKAKPKAEQKSKPKVVVDKYYISLRTGKPDQFHLEVSGKPVLKEEYPEWDLFLHHSYSYSYNLGTEESKTWSVSSGLTGLAVVSYIKTRAEAIEEAKKRLDSFKADEPDRYAEALRYAQENARSPRYGTKPVTPKPVEPAKPEVKPIKEESEYKSATYAQQVYWDRINNKSTIDYTDKQQETIKSIETEDKDGWDKAETQTIGSKRTLVGYPDNIDKNNPMEVLAYLWSVRHMAEYVWRDPTNAQTIIGMREAIVRAEKMVAEQNSTTAPKPDTKPRVADKAAESETPVVETETETTPDQFADTSKTIEKSEAKSKGVQKNIDALNKILDYHIKRYEDAIQKEEEALRKDKDSYEQTDSSERNKVVKEHDERTIRRRERSLKTLREDRDRQLGIKAVVNDPAFAKEEEQRVNAFISSQEYSDIQKIGSPALEQEFYDKWIHNRRTDLEGANFKLALREAVKVWMADPGRRAKMVGDPKRLEINKILSKYGLEIALPEKGKLAAGDKHKIVGYDKDKTNGTITSVSSAALIDMDEKRTIYKAEVRIGEGEKPKTPIEESLWSYETPVADTSKTIEAEISKRDGEAQRRNIDKAIADGYDALDATSADLRGSWYLTKKGKKNDTPMVWVSKQNLKYAENALANKPEAKAKAKAKGYYVMARRGGSESAYERVDAPDAKPLSTKQLDYQELDLFYRRENYEETDPKKKGDWIINTGLTGSKIASGRTLKEAISKAETTLETAKQKNGIKTNKELAELIVEDQKKRLAAHENWLNERKEIRELTYSYDDFIKGETVEERVKQREEIVAELKKAKADGFKYYVTGRMDYEKRPIDDAIAEEEYKARREAETDPDKRDIMDWAHYHSLESLKRQLKHHEEQLVKPNSLFVNKPKEAIQQTIDHIKAAIKLLGKETKPEVKPPQPSRQKLSDTLSKSLSSDQVDATMKLYDAMFQTYADELGITLDEAYEYLSDVVTTMPEGQFYLQQENASEIAEAERQMEEVRSKYEGTDKWMKAPNGKPTNLNERQWLQVRTENFKKWFGDWENDPANASKVVDENGEPMVVYHGGTFSTDADGIFITDNGVHFGTKGAAEARIGTFPIDRFISEATIEYDDDIGAWFWSSQGYDSYEDVSEEGYDTEAEARRDLEQFAGTVFDMVDEFMETEITEVFLNLRTPMKEGDAGADWTSAIGLAKATEHDSIRYINQYENAGSVSWIAFSPNQIKSATANVGTFDAENPDIRYQAIRGFVQFKDGKATLGIVDPDFSTAVHEQAHIGLRLISKLAEKDKTGKWKSLLEKAAAWAGAKDGNWDVESEEKFAMGYEKYLLEGKAPNPQVATLFGKIKQWMSAIVVKAKELAGLKLDDNIISVYDAMLGLKRDAKPNLNSEQKAESVKIKNNLKLKSDNTAKTLEKELDSLLDKFGNLVYSKPSSKKILINNVDLNRNIIEIIEEDGFIVNGKAFPSVYDAMQEVTRLLSDSSSTNTVTLKQIKRINFSDDILFQRNIERSRDISRREKRIIAEAYGRVSSAISKSMSFSEWRNSLIDLVDTLIKTKHGAEKVDALALSSVADVNFISAALSRQTKYETILRDMTGFSNIDEVSTFQLFELVQQLDPDFYNTISNNEYLNNLLEATDRVSRALGVDSEIAMSDIFRVTMGESRKFARYGAITKNVARPAEVIISAFGNAGRNLVAQTYKGKLLHAKIQNRSAMTMRDIDKILNTSKNSAGRRYTADEKDLIGRMIFYIGSNEAIQNHRMAFKDEVERSNKVSSEQVDIADVLSIYDSIRDLMTYFEAEGMALNERVGKEIFFSRPEYIFRVFQTVASPIVDELESQEIQLAEAPNLKRRERKVPEMSKLNVDIIPALKGYVNRTSRYISYYELKDYYQNRFAKDVPSNLKSRASELRKYLVNYINAAIGSYEKKSRFDVVMSQARLNLYASVLSSNIGLTLQNFNQRNLASVYAAPKVFRKVIRDSRFFSGKPSKRMRSSKLMELMDELHSSGENQMTEFYREGEEALMESKDVYARGTLNISGKVMKYAPFTVAERGNWSYGYLTGIYNAVMASRQYQKAIKEGKTHYEATEIALSNQQVRDAAIISAGEINAAINADPSLVFSPAMYQTQVGKWMFFTKFFVNFLNLARNVADMKGISGRWSRELFNYQLSGTDEQARITDRVRSLNLMLEDLSPKNIKAMLAKHGSRLSSAGMDSKDFAKMYVEIKKLRDEQVELLRDTNTNFLTGSRLQRKMLSRLAAYAFGDFLIQIIMQALRYWLADVNPGDIYSRKLRGKIMKKNEMDVLGSVLAATQVSRLGQGFGLWSGLFPKLDTRTTKGTVKSATTWGLNLVPGLGLLDSTAGQIYGARPTHIILDDLFEDK